jgi:hypothetical protein
MPKRWQTIRVYSLIWWIHIISGPPRSIKFIAPYTWRGHGWARNICINRPTRGRVGLNWDPDELLGSVKELGRLVTGVKTCLEPSTISSIARATDIENCGLSSKPLSQNSSEVVADRQGERPSPCSSLFYIIISISILYYLCILLLLKNEKLFSFTKWNVEKMYNFFLQNHVTCSSGTGKVMKEYIYRVRLRQVRVEVISYFVCFRFMSAASGCYLNCIMIAHLLL